MPYMKFLYVFLSISRLSILFYQFIYLRSGSLLRIYILISLRASTLISLLLQVFLAILAALFFHLNFVIVLKHIPFHLFKSVFKKNGSWLSEKCVPTFTVHWNVPIIKLWLLNLTFSTCSVIMESWVL